MHRLINLALTLLLAGTAPSLVGFGTVVAALSARQIGRAAVLHPWAAAAGLLALPLGAACWLLARHRLDALDGDACFRAWRLREL